MLGWVGTCAIASACSVVSAKLANQILRLPVFRVYSVDLDARLNAESRGNSWGRQARQGPKCLDFVDP